MRRRTIQEIHGHDAETDYQAYHHLIANSPWDEAGLHGQIWRDADRLLGGSVDTALIVDPSGFPKRGNHSVGVDRQWCGQLGKVDNCQVAVFAALANGRDAVLTDRRLYLPKSWTDDEARLKKAKVPEDKSAYKTHADLALEMIEAADANKVRYSFVSMDGEFGNNPKLLRKLDDTGHNFMIDIHKDQTIYLYNPRLSVKRENQVGDGRGSLRLESAPMRVDAYVRSLGARGWRKLKLRQGTKGDVNANILHTRVWHWDGEEQRPRQWHLIVRRRTAKKGLKYSLSNAPPELATKRLAYWQSQRQWVERSIRDAKQEAGISDYQVRTWRAWHHHATLSIMAAMWMLEARLEYGARLPLLSVRDIRDLMAQSVVEDSDRANMIQRVIDRHKRRRAAVESAKRRPPPD